MSAMQAIQFKGKGEATLAHLSIGAVPPGHALLRVRASGCVTPISTCSTRAMAKAPSGDPRP